MIGAPTFTQLAARLPGARLQGADLALHTISTDTRTLVAGDVFVALRGERFDGHDHLASAIGQGAAAVIVDHEIAGLAVPQLIVRNTLAALGQIAALNREAFSGPVIALTGSSGKTTLRSMISQILALTGPVLATQGNLNNHIGVPLTLLRLQAEHRLAVIEMGASARGEIAGLCEIARPTLALINNIMPAHIEGFGSLEGIADAKAEIYQGLVAEGVAVINLDESWACYWHELVKPRRSYTFALEKPQADAFARQIRLCADYSDFELVIQQQVVPVRLRMAGQHHVRNAVAAALVAFLQGATLAQIREGLESFEPVSGRMLRQPGVHGATLIDDSYNANPGSVKAAIDSLALYPGKRILVLGDMAELGEHSESLHTEVGEHALKRNIDHLFSVGNASRFASQAAGAKGQHYHDQQQLIRDLTALADHNTVFLIKGSRSARTDLIVAALSSHSDACGELH